MTRGASPWGRGLSPSDGFEQLLQGDLAAVQIDPMVREIGDAVASAAQDLSGLLEGLDLLNVGHGLWWV